MMVEGSSPKNKGSSLCPWGLGGGRKPVEIKGVMENWCSDGTDAGEFLYFQGMISILAIHKASAGLFAETRQN